MNDNNVFEYISKEDNIIPIDNKSTNDVKEEEDKTNQFVSGLPDWDLEPPYEIVRRNQM